MTNKQENLLNMVPSLKGSPFRIFNRKYVKSHGLIFFATIFSPLVFLPWMSPSFFVVSFFWNMVFPCMVLPFLFFIALPISFLSCSLFFTTGPPCSSFSFLLLCSRDFPLLVFPTLLSIMLSFPFPHFCLCIQLLSSTLSFPWTYPFLPHRSFSTVSFVSLSIDCFHFSNTPTCSIFIYPPCLSSPTPICSSPLLMLDLSIFLFSFWGDR